MMTTRRPRRPGRQRQGGASAAPERRAPLRSRRSGRRSCRVAGLLRGPHHLADEGLRTLGALVAVADAAGPDMEVVVARASWLHAPREMAAMALGALKSLDIYGKSASRRGSPMCRKIQPNQPLAPDRRRRFYLAVRWSGSWAPTFRHSNVRHSPPACDQARPASWLPISMRHADKQARRLRREPGPILRWTVGRSLARMRIG